jgi:hypothetical protein
VIQSHLLQEAERLSELVIDRGSGVVDKNLLSEPVISESRRRDRGVGIRSKRTLIQTRHEGSEQLAFSDGPYRRTTHDSLCVRSMRVPKEMPVVPQRSDDVRRPKTREQAHHAVK